jgi:hypothetical protein
MIDLQELEDKSNCGTVLSSLLLETKSVVILTSVRITKSYIRSRDILRKKRLATSAIELNNNGMKINEQIAGLFYECHLKRVSFVHRIISLGGEN